MALADYVFCHVQIGEMAYPLDVHENCLQSIYSLYKTALAYTATEKSFRVILGSLDRSGIDLVSWRIDLQKKCVHKLF